MLGIGRVVHGGRAFCCQFGGGWGRGGELAGLCTVGVRFAASSAGAGAGLGNWQGFVRWACVTLPVRWGWGRLLAGGRAGAAAGAGWGVGGEAGG